MPTDYKRLQETWELRNRVGTEYMPRQSGKTFLRVHELAASICLGRDDFFVVEITDNRDIYYLGPMISDVFEEYGIQILPGRGGMARVREMKVRYCHKEATIVFVSKSVYRLQSSMGHRFAPNEYGIVPMGQWD